MLVKPFLTRLLMFASALRIDRLLDCLLDLLIDSLVGWLVD